MLGSFVCGCSWHTTAADAPWYVRTLRKIPQETRAVRNGTAVISKEILLMFRKLQMITWSTTRRSSVLQLHSPDLPA